MACKGAQVGQQIPCSGWTVMTRQQSPAHAHESKERQDAFLERFSECGSILQAAQEAGMDRKLHYKWLVEVEGYKERYQQARLEAIESLEARVFQRANVESDRLAEFLLKGLKPEVYGDRFKAEHSGVNGGAIQT